MNEIESIAAYMRKHHLLLATAESCTAGLIAARLVDAPGAGDILDCAFVTYSPAAKQGCLSVSKSTLDRFGLTSEEVSIEMARGALSRSRANVAIANTGVTEPMPDGPPAGTQCFSWVFKDATGDLQVFSRTHRFQGTRNEIRGASADFALQLLVSLHASLTQTAGDNTRNAAMTKAKLEPGDKTITPAAPAAHAKQGENQEERDLLPELGLKRPAAKPQTGKASPLNPDIDLGSNAADGLPEIRKE